MAATAIKEHQLKVDSFLGKQMRQNTKTNAEIQALRSTECAEVTIQGDNILKLTIEDLETRFQQQQEQPGTATMLTIPSTDILQWKSSFPLQETSEQVLAELHNNYKDMFTQGEDKIKQEEARIDDELQLIGNGQDVRQTANNIADIVEDAVIVGPAVSPDSPVRKKLRRELEEALQGTDRKTGLFGVLRNILHEGIDMLVRKTNKTKWGMMVNRRGQVGENKTVAAINEAVHGYVGISVSGMKTYSYLHEFLDKLGIKLTYTNTRDPVTGKVKKTNEVEHDFIMTYLENDSLTVTMVESKTREFKPWAPSNQAENAKAAVEHANKAFQQLLKDFKTFKEIFPDITATMLTKMRFQYFVALSDVSDQDWPSEAPPDHIIFKEDIEDISRLQSKLKLPSTPPTPSTISSDIKYLHYMIGARYVGGASLIKMKTPEEGFSQQGTLLKRVRAGFEHQVDKVFMMGREQQAVFQSGLNNFANFGGHGSGKTVLLQAVIRRNVMKIIADQDTTTEHLLILCVWQKGADALLCQYRDLVTELPQANNLEVIVVTKEELMKKFKANITEIEATTTTHQINTLCQNIGSLMNNKQVHLHIDECWVTVPKTYSAHLTMANPNDVVGHIPFIRNGVLYPWSKLNPGLVKLSLAVMPDCQHLLEKDLITALPPQQGPVFTVFAPRSFRTTMRIHALVKHIQLRVEKDLRVWRYLLPPNDEKDGHEIMGSLPVWQPVKHTDHFICQKDDCDQCYLKNVTKSLLSHVSDSINNHGAKPEDIVFILSQGNSRTCTDAVPAMQYLRLKFPGVEIKFDDEFEGMEKAVIVNLTNGSIGTSPSIIPVSLTRANSHLVMFCEDFRNILEDATDKGLVKKSQTDLPPTSSNTGVAPTATGLAEASETLCNMAREMSFNSIQNLSQEWGVEDKYHQLVNQEKTRIQMIRLMFQKRMEDSPFTTLAQFIESIRIVNMSEAVTNKMAENLKANIDELKEIITAKHLTENEQIELAHSLGKRELFNSLTQPEDLFLSAVSDQEALQRCLQSWMDQAQETTTEDLMKSLQMAGLFRIVSALTESQSNRFEVASFENMSMGQQVKTTTLEVFLPLITAILAVILLAVLYSNNLHTQFWVLLCLHWIPSGLIYSMNTHINYKYFGTSMNNPKLTMLVLLICQPVGSIILHIMHLLKRTTYGGQAVERYKMEKILRQAEASVKMSNFTSLLILIFTLHMANTGVISTKNLPLLALSTVTAVLHLAKLMKNITKNHSRADLSLDVVLQSSLVVLSTLSSLVLKIASLISFLSSDIDTTYVFLFGCGIFILSLVANLWLEKRFLTRETEEEEKQSFLRAAHSLIFPLAPEVQNKKQLLGVSLQLFVGNIVVASLGFLVSLTMGVTENMLITQNMVKSFCLITICLIIYASIAYQGISALLISTGASRPIDDFEEYNESSPLLGNQNISQQASTSAEPDDLEDPLLDNHTITNAKASLKKAGHALGLLLVLMLILTSVLPLLVYQFNTCPSFPSTPHSKITCMATPQTFGSTCNLTCPPLYWSTSELTSYCLMTGAWSERDLTCRPQVAAVVGVGDNQTLDQWLPATDIYPATGSRSHLPGLPMMGGSTAYIDGGILYCGGFNIHDASASPIKSCYYLKHPTPQWEEIFPLLQETVFASTAVVEDGQAMLVMGGRDHNHVHYTTNIVRPGKPTQPGPNMTEEANMHCSTTLLDGSVITMGGSRRSNPYGSARTEMLNFTTKDWSKLGNMRQRRLQHSCTQVWLNPNDTQDDILKGLVTNASVLGVVVAGGVYLDGDVYQPTSSVELYLPWNDTWSPLPALPHFTDDDGTVWPMTNTHIKSLAITDGTNSLHLVGGINYDWKTGSVRMTSKVWHLVCNHADHSYYWDNSVDTDMDMIMDTGESAAVGVPDNFFQYFNF